MRSYKDLFDSEGFNCMKGKNLTERFDVIFNYDSENTQFNFFHRSDIGVNIESLHRMLSETFIYYHFNKSLKKNKDIRRRISNCESLMQLLILAIDTRF